MQNAVSGRFRASSMAQPAAHSSFGFLACLSASRAKKRAAAGPAVTIMTNRIVCSAITNGKSTSLEAAIMATESMPPPKVQPEWVKNEIFDQLPWAYPRCRLVLAADSMQLRRCARFFRKKRRPTQCVHGVGQTRSKEILSRFLFELCCIHCCVPTWRTIRATTTSIGRLIHKFNLTNKPNIVNLRETAQGNPSTQHLFLQ